MATLADVSTHAPPHTDWPIGHTHAPATQAVPPVHGLPHAPQFTASVWRSTQAPPHATRGAVQAAAHAPALHTWPMGHASPHAPQLDALVARSTHTPPQRLWPAAQAHTPDVHDWPPAHAVAQLPQCRASLWRSTQLAPQVVSAAPHDDAQAPSLHT